jgi:hypothetical protein
MEAVITQQPRSGRPRSTRTPQTVETIKAKIEHSSGKSIRQMAKECKINEITFRRVIKDFDLSTAVTSALNEMPPCEIRAKYSQTKFTPLSTENEQQKQQQPQSGKTII